MKATIIDTIEPKEKVSVFNTKLEKRDFSSFVTGTIKIELECGEYYIAYKYYKKHILLNKDTYTLREIFDDQI
jgi:hypothetical protein